MPFLLPLGMFALAVIGLFATTSLPAAAEPTTIKAELWNNASGEGIKLSQDKVKAGVVEFEVANVSKDLPHDFLLVPWEGAITSLPFDQKSGQVKEDALPGVEGIKGVKPRQKAILRLVLKPGRYVVFCDEVGHYPEGMETGLTVVP